MKTVVYAGNEERAILTALVVHDGVLARIYSRIGKEKEPFRSRWSNLVARWCFQHFTKYNRAPRQAIQQSFARFAEVTKDQEAIDLVETFLATLSENYRKHAKEINERYTIDLASRFFDKIRLQRLADQITECVDRNDVKEAISAQAEFETLNFGSSDWADPFSEEEVKDTFRYYEEERSVIQFPGDLGRFLSPHFERDGFVAFAGPEKRGKSYWLQEVVWQGLKQKRRILYYCFGDMGKEQVKRRLYVRAACRPWKEQELQIPVLLQPPNGEGQELRFEKEARHFEGLSMKLVHRARLKLSALTATKDLRLKLLCAGGGVKCAGEIEKEVADFVRDGWVPDLCVIDYADLLAPEPHTTRLDKRHQIDANWQILRRIALEHHALVVTATQAATRGYEAKVLRMKDFSEDKRKNAHVTGLIGINQFGDEKRNGIYRLNWVVLREGNWASEQTVWTAGNLALANPCIISALPGTSARR